jgi:signal peptidase I
MQDPNQPVPVIKPSAGNLNNPDNNIKKSKHSKGDIKNIVYTISLFVLAPLFALLMIIFIFQSYVVDGSSMEPTLQNGNRVFILKLPKTLSSLQNKSFMPKQYEIIVFKKPSEPDVQLIKRVIGLPGDRVVVQDNHMTIYNAKHPNGYNPDENTDYGPTLVKTTGGSVDITVGPEEVFVVGDNRNPSASLDSRFPGVGLVPVENIVGRLWVRYFPLNEIKLFGTISTMPIEIKSNLSNTNTKLL